MTSQVVVWDLFHQHHNLHFESIEFASNLQHCFFARFFCSKGFRAFDCGISESSMNIYIYIHIDAFSHSCIKNFNCSVDLLKGKCKCSRCAFLNLDVCEVYVLVFGRMRLECVRT